jgi:hypothetical protein
MFDTLLNRFDLLASLNRSRAGQAAHASAIGLLTTKMGIGSGKGFLFHVTDYNTFSRIKP